MINNYLYDYGFTFKDLFIENPPDDKKPSGGSIQKNQTYIFNSLKLERVYSS